MDVPIFLSYWISATQLLGPGESPHPQPLANVNHSELQSSGSLFGSRILPTTSPRTDPGYPDHRCTRCQPICCVSRPSEKLVGWQADGLFWTVRILANNQKPTTTSSTTTTPPATTTTTTTRRTRRTRSLVLLNSVCNQDAGQNQLIKPFIQTAGSFQI